MALAGQHAWLFSHPAQARGRCPFTHFVQPLAEDLKVVRTLVTGLAQAPQDASESETCRSFALL